MIRWYSIKATLVQCIFLISLQCKLIAVDGGFMPEDIGNEFLRWRASLSNYSYEYSAVVRDVSGDGKSMSEHGRDSYDVSSGRFQTERLSQIDSDTYRYSLWAWDGERSYVIERILRHGSVKSVDAGLSVPGRITASVGDSPTASRVLLSRALTGGGLYRSPKLQKEENKTYQTYFIQKSNLVHLIFGRGRLNVEIDAFSGAPSSIYAVSDYPDVGTVKNYEYLLGEWINVEGIQIPFAITERMLVLDTSDGRAYPKLPIQYRNTTYKLKKGTVKVNYDLQNQTFKPKLPVGTMVHDQITGARYTVENEGPLVESEARIQQRLEELIEEAKSDEGAGK